MPSTTLVSSVTSVALVTARTPAGSASRPPLRRPAVPRLPARSPPPQHPQLHAPPLKPLPHKPTTTSSLVLEPAVSPSQPNSPRTARRKCSSSRRDRHPPVAGVVTPLVGTTPLGWLGLISLASMCPVCATRSGSTLLVLLVPMRVRWPDVCWVEELRSMPGFGGGLILRYVTSQSLFLRDTY